MIKHRETANLKKKKKKKKKNVLNVDAKMMEAIVYRVCRNCGGSVIKETVEPPKLSMNIEILPYKCFESFQSFLVRLCKSQQLRNNHTNNSKHWYKRRN